MSSPGAKPSSRDAEELTVQIEPQSFATLCPTFIDKKWRMSAQIGGWRDRRHIDRSEKSTHARTVSRLLYFSRRAQRCDDNIRRLWQPQKCAENGRVRMFWYWRTLVVPHTAVLTRAGACFSACVPCTAPRAQSSTLPARRAPRTALACCWRLRCCLPRAAGDFAALKRMLWLMTS